MTPIRTGELSLSRFTATVHHADDDCDRSPANAEAAQLYRENMKEYVRRVKATVEDSWLDPDEREEVQETDREESASS